MSVAIGCLNEGPDLEAMIAMMLAGETVPDEIVVCDDCSVEPVAPRLASLPRVKVVTPEKRLGSGGSKHAAAAACTGDIVVVMDSHMRPAWDWLTVMKAEHDEHPTSIICARSRSFRSSETFDGRGAVLSMEKAGFWEPKWAQHKDAPGCYRVPCVIGGTYLIPRLVMDRVGGYAPGQYGYGCEEEYLSLRAYLCGFDCRVSTTYIAHHYGRVVDRRTSCGSPEHKWEMAFNRHVAAYACFGQDIYEKVYAPLLWKAHGPLDGLTMALTERAPDIRDASEIIKSHRLRTDDQLADLIGVVHPKE